MKWQKLAGRWALFLSAAFMAVQSARVLFNVAWGTGNWLGQFSLKWGLAFFAFAVLCLAVLILTAAALWRPDALERLIRPLAVARARSGWMRWMVALAALVFPVWLFEFSYLGLVLVSPVFRTTIWLLVIFLCGFLLTRDLSRSFSWRGILLAALLSAGAIVLAAPLQDVSSYPFSLGWSEGNRLWDYSILFGRGRYIYPADKSLSPFLDIGRQLTGGLPFLYSGLTIWQARFWQGLMDILPYLALSLVVFRKEGKSHAIWLLAGLWGYAFLRQGPIHTPLVVSAVVVALAWRRPLWLAAPLIAVAAYFAAVSRFTWMFAPSIWAGMLVMLDAPLENGRVSRQTWIRAIVLGAAGLMGGYFVPLLMGKLHAAATISNVSATVTRQPLLWYRLLPNSTLGPGVLLILVEAVLPLIVLLFFVFRSPTWLLNLWQKLAALGSMLAFLAVGVVASTKIGGGGDLHNLDMFIIGLLFLAGLVWDKLGYEWVLSPSDWLPLAAILLLALPARIPLNNLTPLLSTNDFERLKTLTGAQRARELGLLPGQDVVNDSLHEIQKQVNAAQKHGEVLFMDQRQLLTFGYIKNVSLVPEYEKKFMMDRAMSDSPAPVFESFYADLKAHRFSLIVSEPLHLPTQDAANAMFGEENNAWVKWVSAAVLCYYEPDETLNDVRVQLLVPRHTPVECELPLP